MEGVQFMKKPSTLLELGAAFTRKMRIYHVTYVELCGICEGLELACARGFNKTVVESDSKVTISLIK